MAIGGLLRIPVGHLHGRQRVQKIAVLPLADFSLHPVKRGIALRKCRRNRPAPIPAIFRRCVIQLPGGGSNCDGVLRCDQKRLAAGAAFVELAVAAAAAADLERAGGHIDHFDGEQLELDGISVQYAIRRMVPAQLGIVHGKRPRPVRRAIDPRAHAVRGRVQRHAVRRDVAVRRQRGVTPVARRNAIFQEHPRRIPVARVALVGARQIAPPRVLPRQSKPHLLMAAGFSGRNRQFRHLNLVGRRRHRPAQPDSQPTFLQHTIFHFRLLVMFWFTVLIPQAGPAAPPYLSQCPH